MRLYFDLHCHSASKTFMTSEFMDQKKSPWEKVSGELPQLFAPILSSQASFGQVEDANVSILVTSIVPLERGYTDYWLIKGVVANTTALSRDFIMNINKGQYSFYDLLNLEIKFIFNHLHFGSKKLNILKTIEDIDHSDGVINLLFNIEGSHSFDARRNGIEEANYLENLKEIKRRDDFNCFYLTFTHLNKLFICNHAYGAKISNDNIFKPHKEVIGIDRDLGLKMIDTCYDKADGTRMLIDIKHMSLVARQQFYAYRKEKGYENIPILASHMGVTGFPFSEFHHKIKRKPKYNRRRKDYVKVKYKRIDGIGEGRKEETCFNPWSINLYDEEIIEIIQSDGLIGVCLDQRILGYDDIKPEYFSYKEWQVFNDTDFKITPNPDITPLTTSIELLALENDDLEEDDDFELIPDATNNIESLVAVPLIHTRDISDEMIEEDGESDMFEEVDLKGKKRRHLRTLCNNILHIAKVGGEEAWKHICIGSDLDGFVNAINNCKRITGYRELEEDLISMLNEMIVEHQHPNLPILTPEDLAQKVRDIMYNNGKDFLEKYFTKDFLGA